MMLVESLREPALRDRLKPGVWRLQNRQLQDSFKVASRLILPVPIQIHSPEVQMEKDVLGPQLHRA